VGVHVSRNAVVDFLVRLPTQAGEEVVDVRVAEQVVPIAVPTVPDATARSPAVQLGTGTAGSGSADASEAPPISVAPLAATPTTALRTIRPDTNMGTPPLGGRTTIGPQS
jgi:hypothetical protein